MRELRAKASDVPVSKVRAPAARGQFAVATRRNARATIWDSMGSIPWRERLIASRIEFIQNVYDPLNRPIQVTTSLESTGPGVPPSTVTRYMAYTSTALKWQVTDELGRQTETYYDGAARALQMISPLVDNGSGVMESAITQTAYDGNHNVIQKINPLGNIWQYQYDARNRKLVELEPGPTGAPPGPTIYHAYDPVGNAISLTDANGFTTNTAYDQANRPIVMEAPAVTAPDGTMQRPITTTGYDKNGNVVSVIDPNGNETVNAYDAINRLISTTDAEDITVSYAYDLTDNRISVTDGKSQTTQFAYDGHKRHTSITDPAGSVTTLGHDAINKISRLDPLGQETLYAYDLRNHLLTTTYTGRSEDDRTYTYDLVGNLLSVTISGYSGAADAAYTYDALNRHLTETSGGLTHQYKYDLANNRIYVQYGGTGRTLFSTYDQLNRLIMLTERTTTYAYDANGNEISKKLPNGETVTTAYDALNRRVAISAPTYSYQQLYDLVGNLAQIQESYPVNPSMNRAVSNIYDPINRLANETFSTLPLVVDGGSGLPPYYPAADTITSVSTYAYDAAHNRIQRVWNGVTTAYTYDNPLNQLSQWSDGTNTVTYTYDLDGNRSTRTEAGVTDTYGYDYDNRLLSTTSAGVSYTYIYDYRTRRVNRVEGGTSTQIIFSGGTSIAEYGTGSTLQVEYIRGSGWGGGVGGILYTIRSEVASFTHFNSRGDVTAKTDANGAVTWQAEYEAFGEHPDETGSTLDRQKANTKEEDPTGLLNEGFRYRDLETGEFITKDPLGTMPVPTVGRSTEGKSDPYNIMMAKEKWYLDGREVSEQKYYRTVYAGKYVDASPSKTAKTTRDEKEDHVEKSKDGNQEPGQKSHYHAAAAGLPNLYIYVNQNPWTSFDPEGLDTWVQIGLGTVGNPLGHVSFATDLAGAAHSFGTGTKPGTTFSDYMSKQTGYRSSIVFDIKTTPEQEAAMEKFASQFKTTDLPKVPGKDSNDNCASRTSDALRAGGVSGIEHEVLPGGLLDDLMMKAIKHPNEAKSYTVPQNSKKWIPLQQ